MTTRLLVNRVRFEPAPSGLREAGLLGWISLDIADALRIDGIAVRRTRDGRRVLSFPAKTDRYGKRRFYVRPLGDEMRREFEREVFAALGVEDERR